MTYQPAQSPPSAASNRQQATAAAWRAPASVIAVRVHPLFFFFSSKRRHTGFGCDWSSDVCSSDLGHPWGHPQNSAQDHASAKSLGNNTSRASAGKRSETAPLGVSEASKSISTISFNTRRARSEERRVGKEGRSRWSPDH